jgi:uncharacterized protein YdiU (UPF0061 family)
MQGIQRDIARMQRAEHLSKLDPAVKAQSDKNKWVAWLRRYMVRLQQEADAGADPQRRIKVMNGVNPRRALLAAVHNLAKMLEPALCSGSSSSGSVCCGHLHVNKSRRYVLAVHSHSSSPFAKPVARPSGLPERNGTHINALVVPSRYVLRNWIAQQAIDAAEKGDYSEVRRVLRLLQRPFSDDAAVGLDNDPQVKAALTPGRPAYRRELLYDGPVPAWAKGLCVSCSS